MEDTENEALGRGTLIKLHLKAEALEYAEEYKLKELIKRYSEFMNFPIYFQTEKEVDVPIEEAEAEEAEDDEAAKGDDGEDGVADEEEGEEGEEEEAPKTRKEKQLVWELVNDSKAIWLRKPSEVEKEEYQKFYKAVSKVKGKRREKREGGSRGAKCKPLKECSNDSQQQHGFCCTTAPPQGRPLGIAVCCCLLFCSLHPALAGV